MSPTGTMRLFAGVALLAVLVAGAAWYLAAPAPTTGASAAGADTEPRAPDAPDAPPRRADPAPASAALPPADMPLKQSYAELLAGMNRGDAAATSRLYLDLNRCARAKAVIRASARFADDVLSQRPDVGSSQETQLDQAERRMRNAERLKQLCADVDESMLRSIAAVTLRAAQLGDAGARTCYVHRGPFMNPQEMIEHPESISVYRSQAPALVEEALRQGDWKMVDMLQYAYSPRSGTMLAGLVGHDDAQYYRYLKLFRLGADAGAIKRIDKELTDAASVLTPEQIAQADGWAKTTFERDFRGISNEAAPQRWDACAVPED